MLYSAFLLFEGRGAPKGDSQDANHKDHIEISNFQFGAENPATISSGAARGGAGTLIFQSFGITKRVDKTSPVLFRACGAGMPYDTVTLKLATRGASGNQDRVVYTFKLVYITNIAWPSGKDDEVPMEQIEMVFGAMRVSIPTEDAPGVPGRPVEESWSQVKNAPTLDIQ